MSAFSFGAFLIDPICVHFAFVLQMVGAIFFLLKHLFPRGFLPRLIH